MEYHVNNIKRNLLLEQTNKNPGNRKKHKIKII